MKKYRYKFSVLMYVVMSLAIILSIVTIILNVKNLVTIEVKDKHATYAVSILIGFLIMAFVITAVSLANYRITKDGIVTQISFIKSTIEFKLIKSIAHLKLSNKLAIYFEDETFIHINVSPKHYDDIVAEIKVYKNTIEYRVTEEY